MKIVFNVDWNVSCQTSKRTVTVNMILTVAGQGPDSRSKHTTIVKDWLLRQGV